MKKLCIIPGLFGVWYICVAGPRLAPPYTADLLSDSITSLEDKVTALEGRCNNSDSKYEALLDSNIVLRALIDASANMVTADGLDRNGRDKDGFVHGHVDPTTSDFVIPGSPGW